MRNHLSISSDRFSIRSLRVLVVSRSGNDSGVLPPMAESCRAVLERLCAKFGAIRVEHLQSRRAGDSGLVERLAAGIEVGAWDVVVAGDLTRMGRGSVQLLRMLETAIDHKVRVITPDDKFDTADAQSMEKLLQRL